MIKVEKELFRETEEWKKFRHQMYKEYPYDYISQLQLEPNFHLHHMVMTADLEDYKNLDIEKFLPLSEKTHSVVHSLYSLYRRDPSVLERLKIVLDIMVKLSPQEEENRKQQVGERAVQVTGSLEPISREEANFFLDKLSDLYQHSVSANTNGCSYNDFLNIGIPTHIIEKMANWHFVAFNKGKNYAAFIPWKINKIEKYKNRTIDNLRLYASGKIYMRELV